MYALIFSVGASFQSTQRVSVKSNGTQAGLYCVSSIGSSGEPQLSGSTAFQLTATGVPSHKTGLALLGLSAEEAPFAGGTLCISQVYLRSPSQLSAGGDALDDCSGSFAWHLDPAELAKAGLLGTPVYAQWVSRDPGFAPGEQFSMSNALAFALCP